MVLRTSDESNVAFKVRIRPAHRGCEGLECTHGGWSKEFGEIIGVTVIKIVEKDIFGTYDRALIGMWLDVVLVGQCIDN